jgi:transcriptional regulator with XRE-family HTH domain
MSQKDNVQVFPMRLRGARVRRGWNQEDLAKALEVSKGSVGNWESGANIPTPAGLKRLADTLGVSIDFLLGTTGEAGSDARGKIHKYLDLVLDQFGEDVDRISWLFVELQKHFPIKGKSGGSSASSSASSQPWASAAEEALAMEHRIRARSRGKKK